MNNDSFLNNLVYATVNDSNLNNASNFDKYSGLNMRVRGIRQNIRRVQPKIIIVDSDDDEDEETQINMTHTQNSLRINNGMIFSRFANRPLSNIPPPNIPPPNAQILRTPPEKIIDIKYLSIVPEYVDYGCVICTESMECFKEDGYILCRTSTHVAHRTCLFEWSKTIEFPKCMICKNNFSKSKQNND